MVVQSRRYLLSALMAMHTSPEVEPFMKRRRFRDPYGGCGSALHGHIAHGLGQEGASAAQRTVESNRTRRQMPTMKPHACAQTVHLLQAWRPLQGYTCLPSRSSSFR
jgi:hypothetical protein